MSEVTASFRDAQAMMAVAAAMRQGLPTPDPALPYDADGVHVVRADRRHAGSSALRSTWPQLGPGRVA
jgi:hypothetical protein